jgi:predicted transcriptional regulator
MDILHQLGECSARDVRERLADAPTYSAVRATLSKLVDKGVAAFRIDGKRYLYAPTEDAATAQRSALKHVVRTFFDDSPAKAASALLGMSANDLEEEELEGLRLLVDRLEQEGHS